MLDTITKVGRANELAFLDMIAHAERILTVTGSDDGYKVLYGGGLFLRLSELPAQTPYLSCQRQAGHQYGGRALPTVGALLGRVSGEHALARRLHAEDQDRIALPQIRERPGAGDIGASISTT
ncbi:hypothetical protein J3P77_09760 [Pseudomonas sp. R1-18]|uniref:hypothetical protein n=1 Tax=Pseudomonas sp. R1-18 TaxID=1632772 RepID=UPI003DA7B5B1